MAHLKPVVLGVSLALALTCGGVVASADEHHPSGGGGHPSGGGHPGGPAGRAGPGFRPGPGFHGGPGGRPGPGFRAGPGFRGGPGFRSGGSRFHGRDFAHFTPAERAAWTGGAWEHGWRNGRFGWWWGVGGLWYLYSAPIYPYPTYVADTYFDPGYDADAGYDAGYDQGMDTSQAPAGGGPSGYWYYCQPSGAYYPYVQSCPVPWTPVAPTGPSQ